MSSKIINRVNDNINISNIIIKLYTKLNLSQIEFAERIGFTPAAISKLKTGKSKALSKGMVAAICAINWPGHGYVNRTFLLTGKGDMFLAAKQENNLVQFKQETINETLQERITSYHTKNKSNEKRQKLQAMIVALIDIMESENNTVKTAIESNLVAFQYTVQSDKKMERFEQEIKELKRIIKTDFETRKLQRAGAARIKGGKN